MTTEHLKSLTRDAIDAINRGDIERAVSYTAPGCTLNGESLDRASRSTVLESPTSDLRGVLL